MRLDGLRIALLAAWGAALVSYALFAVYPAFQVGIPSDQAANLLAHGFVGLDRAGLVAGSAATVLGLASARGGAAIGRTRVLLPLLGVAAHLLSLLWVTPEIGALRDAAGGGIAGLTDQEGMARFTILHQLSRGLYLAASAIALSALAWDLVTLPRAATGNRKVT